MQQTTLVLSGLYQPSCAFLFRCDELAVLYMCVCICTTLSLWNRIVLCVSVASSHTDKQFQLAALHVLNVCNVHGYSALVHSQIDHTPQNVT